MTNHVGLKQTVRFVAHARKKLSLKTHCRTATVNSSTGAFQNIANSKGLGDCSRVDKRKNRRKKSSVDDEDEGHDE